MNRSSTASFHPTDFHPIDEEERKWFLRGLDQTRYLYQVQVVRRISPATRRDRSRIWTPTIHLSIINDMPLSCLFSRSLDLISRSMKLSNLWKNRKESVPVPSYTLCLWASSITLDYINWRRGGARHWRNTDQGLRTRLPRHKYRN